MRPPRRLSSLPSLLLLAVAVAGCSAAPSAGPEPGSAVLDAPETETEAETETVAEVETDSVESAAAGFDHDGRRYDLSCGVIDPELVEPEAFATGAGDLGTEESLHRIRGVDPAFLVAVPNDGLCDLTPGQAWQSAFPAEEVRGGRPSAAYNQAWCTASLYGPDPAEGFSC